MPESARVYDELLRTQIEELEVRLRDKLSRIREPSVRFKCHVPPLSKESQADMSLARLDFAPAYGTFSVIFPSVDLNCENSSMAQKTPVSFLGSCLKVALL